MFVCFFIEMTHVQSGVISTDGAKNEKRREKHNHTWKITSFRDVDREKVSAFPHFNFPAPENGTVRKSSENRDVSRSFDYVNCLFLHKRLLSRILYNEFININVSIWRKCHYRIKRKMVFLNHYVNSWNCIKTFFNILSTWNGI